MGPSWRRSAAIEVINAGGGGDAAVLPDTSLDISAAVLVGTKGTITAIVLCVDTRGFNAMASK